MLKFLLCLSPTLSSLPNYNNELAEIHTLACTPVTSQRRKQYTRGFKLATITWRKHSVPPPQGLGLRKYAVKYFRENGYQK
ncbi:hypothetical protein L211DRAFT_832764 [Terfezia boudieri ATCC MYA-4762]|uniref:Uncharacterized protein n=1 Tax=Terfezia boudieri ATCC MYA-4762 TaxID=1051890 RepID=A0A3N4M132_9PEZI|nr:hypothetical protein L211DRAFT_832764 [Terfezia boudieri ATCC MYA-4762]